MVAIVILFPCLWACGNETSGGNLIRDVSDGLRVRVEDAQGASARMPGHGLLILEGVRTLQAESQLVDPSSIPPSSAGVRTIRYSAKITLEVESAETFSYAPDAWGIRLYQPDATARSQLFRLKNENSKLEMIADPFPSDQSGAGRVLTGINDGLLELQINLDENDWERIYELSSQPGGVNPRRIGVELFYDIFGNGTAGSDGYQSVTPVYMQNDIGLIRDPTSVRVVGSSTGELTLEFKGPENTTAFVPAAENKETSSPSVLSGYLVMYWKEGDCDDSGWVFQSNPQFRLDPNVSDPSLSCAYENFAADLGSEGACQLGCGSASSQAYHPITTDRPRTDEDVAIPLQDGACYKVARVPSGRSTFPLTGLQNNERYTIVAWPVDSAGTLGSTRSACVSALPLKVPLASAEKGDASETISDCFVATASSGGRASLAVHYWRVLRDRWLDPLGLSAVYYRHAPAWAAWLRSQKNLQPVVHYLLTLWGSFFVDLDRSWLFLSEWVSTQWKRAMMQLSTEAQAQEVSEGGASRKRAEADLPPSKRLPSREEMSGSIGDDEPRRKKLSSSGVAEDGSLRTKQLPDPIGVGADVDSVPTKELPVALVDEQSIQEEPQRHPLESSSMAVRFGGGILMPVQPEVWDLYYPVDHPKRFFVQNTFRLLDASGELGLGLMASFQTHSGRVPSELGDGSPVNAEVTGRRISYYSGGLYLLTDYRFRYIPQPYVAPRFQLALGAERLRETAAGQGSSQSDRRSGRPGYTLWKPMAIAGIALELSCLALFGQGFYDSIQGYGAEDFLLSLDGAFALDLSGHGFSQTGLNLGAALVLLLE